MSNVSAGKGRRLNFVDVDMCSPFTVREVVRMPGTSRLGTSQLPCTQRADIGLSKESVIPPHALSPGATHSSKRRVVSLHLSRARSLLPRSRHDMNARTFWNHRAQPGAPPRNARTRPPSPPGCKARKPSRQHPVCAQTRRGALTAMAMLRGVCQSLVQTREPHAATSFTRWHRNVLHIAASHLCTAIPFAKALRDPPQPCASHRRRTGYLLASWNWFADARWCPATVWPGLQVRGTEKTVLCAWPPPRSLCVSRWGAAFASNTTPPCGQARAAVSFNLGRCLAVHPGERWQGYFRTRGAEAIRERRDGARAQAP